jgi:peptidoglycan/LPS O-acetylase OafA/YrhL
MSNTLKFTKARGGPETPANGTRAARPSFYRPELDVTRFLGFLIIFLEHANPTDWQLFGGQMSWRKTLYVSVSDSRSVALQYFFVMSAYVITGLVMRERERTGNVDIRKFYIRRALRLLPLYFAALLLSFGAQFLAPGPHVWRYYLAFFLMAGNWTYLWHLSSHSLLGVSHLWSIPVEEQFYLLFPLLAARGSRRLMKVMCILAILGGVMFLSRWQVSDGLSALQWNSFSNFLYFGAGVLVALHYPIDRLPRWSARKRLIAGLGGAGLNVVCSAIFRVSGGMENPHCGLLLGLLCPVRALGLCAVLVSVLGIERPQPKVLVFLGKLTLGLYVFHLWMIELVFRIGGWISAPGPIALAARTALALALTIAASLISYFVLERPCLRLKERFTVVRSRPVELL